MGRIAAWSQGKDFFELINTLGQLEEQRQLGAPLDRNCSAAALKRAYHKVSLSLHPDRLQGLGAAERAEAEEAFKVLSAAYATAKEGRT